MKRFRQCTSAGFNRENLGDSPCYVCSVPQGKWNRWNTRNKIGQRFVGYIPNRVRSRGVSCSTCSACFTHSAKRNGTEQKPPLLIPAERQCWVWWRWIFRLFCEISAGFVGIFVFYQVGVGQHLGVAFDRSLALVNLLGYSGFLDTRVGLDDLMGLCYVRVFGFVL